MNKMSLLSKSTLLTTAVLVLGGGSWSPTMPGVKAFVVPIPTALPPHRSAAGVPSSGAPLRPHTLSTPSGVRAPLWHADSGARGRHSDPKRKRRFWQCLAASVSQRASQKAADPYYDAVESKDRTRVQIKTLLRVVLPSLAVGVISTLVFPGLALFLASTMNDAGVFTVLSQDSSQFVQNFLTVSGLLFSILVGQTYVRACVLVRCCVHVLCYVRSIIVFDRSNDHSQAPQIVHTNGTHATMHSLTQLAHPPPPHFILPHLPACPPPPHTLSLLF